MNLLRIAFVATIASISAMGQATATVSYNETPCKSLGAMTLILGSICQPTITVVVTPQGQRGEIGYSISVRYISPDGDPIVVKQLATVPQDGYFVAYFHTAPGTVAISATVAPLFVGPAIAATPAPN